MSVSQKGSPYAEEGVVHLFLLLIIALVLAGGLYFLFTNNQFSKYIPDSIRPFKTETAIKPAAQYQNPFNKDTQYVNPFSSYKNPFDSLK